ncbi:MAG: DUF3109 family protein [Cyclobacteriaceae bacterium]|nr:DUF3109 family protein [Cyclobacteriaceae bacterium]
MIVIGNTLVSEEILGNFFVCDLEKCKGACCVEGDLGAPLEKSELKHLEQIFEKVKAYLSAEGIQAIEQQGFYIRDFEGDFSTPTVNGKECAYAVYDGSGTLKCGIELAYQDGKIKFRKPVSCHLYPVRVKKYKGFTAVNYDRWHICDPACVLGTELGVPLYQFLKEALIRKFGKAWYAQLVSNVEKEKNRAT